MRMASILLAVPLLGLTGCNMKVDSNDGNGSASISIGGDGTVNTSGPPGGGRVAIDAPGLKADLKIPGLTIGGPDMNIDGMRLSPGTTVTGVNVDGHGGDSGGEVRMALASGEAPAALIAYYQRAGADAGFTVAPPAAEGADRVLAMTKGASKRVRFAFHPEGAGSAGTLVISGDE